METRREKMKLDLNDLPIDKNCFGGGKVFYYKGKEVQCNSWEEFKQKIILMEKEESDKADK